MVNRPLVPGMGLTPPCPRNLSRPAPRSRRADHSVEREGLQRRRAHPTAPPAGEFVTNDGAMAAAGLVAKAHENIYRTRNLVIRKKL